MENIKTDFKQIDNNLQSDTKPIFQTTVLKNNL